MIGASLALLAAASPAAHDLSAFVGRWQIDPSRTHMGRFGPDGHNMVRSPTFTFVFAPAGRDLAIRVYEHYPQAAPTRVMAIVPDGRPHACADKAACQTVGGDAASQTYVHRQIAPRLMVRMFYQAGRLSEYSTYAVSADGRTFTMIAWSPETPQYQNIQVFTRQP